jgi:hypothetical protein
MDDHVGAAEVVVGLGPQLLARLGEVGVGHEADADGPIPPYRNDDRLGAHWRLARILDPQREVTVEAYVRQVASWR